MANFHKFGLLIFIATTLSSSANAEEIWLPTPKRAEQVEKAKICGDIESAKAKIQATLPAKEELIASLTLSVKEAWAKFAACAKESGIPEIRNEIQEAKAAVVCDGLHKKWQNPGFELVLLMKEKSEDEKTMQEMDAQAKLYCVTL